MVVSPNSHYNWIPSNIWVGVGKMTTDDVVFPLAPIYKKKGIAFVQAKAVALWPEGDADDARPAVEVEHTGGERAGETEKIRYDYVVNADRPEAQLRRDPGTRPRRRPHRLRLHARPRDRGVGEARRADRRAARRARPSAS